MLDCGEQKFSALRWMALHTTLIAFYLVEFGSFSKLRLLTLDVGAILSALILDLHSIYVNSFS